MARVATQEGSKRFELLNDVVENARSSVVLLSTYPPFGFRDFEAVPLSAEDIDRYPLRAKRFGIGTKVAKTFAGPTYEQFYGRCCTFWFWGSPSCWSTNMLGLLCNPNPLETRL